MRTKDVVARLITLVVIVLVGLGINYLALPALTFTSAGFWWFIFSMAVISAVAFLVVEYMLMEEDFPVCSIISGIIAALSLLTLILVSFFSSAVFNTESYRQLVTIEDGNFSAEVISVEDGLSIVDVATARKLGDRTIAQVDNSMWYDVSDEYNLIRYNGEYYRISPLEYGSFTKYRRAVVAMGIPGYVLVNARNQEAKFVKLDKGFLLSPSGYFSNDLTRHLRRQYPKFVFGNSFFEIDEEGNPYWITAVMDKTVGLWSCRVEKRFVVTDAVTGKSSVYSVEELPEWVDHAFDLTYLMEGVSKNLLYVGGFWNSVFSKTGVQKLSYDYRDNKFAGYNSTITTDGEVVFFTGVTPANRAESIYGFVQVSPRTGKAKFYAVTGAEESSAQTAAEGLISNYSYKANYPSVVNVDGIPTYFMALKDGAGLVQRYALVNISNYTIAVEDTTIEGAISKYLSKVTYEEVPEVTQIKTATISEVRDAQIEGYTYFYFTFEGEEGLYVSPITNGHKQILLKPGDEITIEYHASKEILVFMVSSIRF